MKGVAICFRKHLDTKIHRISTDKYGTYIIADVTISNLRITLANCYGPNLDDPKYFENLFQEINKMGNLEVILGGDLNTVLKAEDKKGGEILHPKSTKTINNFMEQLNLMDVWKTHHPGSFQFTWKKSKPKLILQRLDYILMSETLVRRTSGSMILPAFKN